RAYVAQLTVEGPVRELLERKQVRPEALTEGVARASAGNFLYLHHYAEGLRAGDDKLLNVKKLPQGLYGIYAYFLRRIKAEREPDVPWTTAYKPVLGILAVAREPLTQRQLGEFTGVDRALVGSIVGDAKQFLDVVEHQSNRLYALYHP